MLVINHNFIHYQSYYSLPHLNKRVTAEYSVLFIIFLPWKGNILIRGRLYPHLRRPIPRPLSCQTVEPLEY